MTLKGEKNHCNVKLFRGYACSIRRRITRWCCAEGLTFPQEGRRSKNSLSATYQALRITVGLQIFLPRKERILFFFSTMSRRS
jgi:hypothetical protein